MDKIIDAKRKEILDFIKENKEKGINIYSNITDINQLIDIIVKWYEFKYPEEKIMQSRDYEYKSHYFIGGLNEYDTRKVENLDKYMGYTELMTRIPSKFHPIIECWYKGELDLDQIANFVSIHLYEIYSNNPANITYRIFKYDGSLDNISKDSSYNYLKVKCNTIEELLDKIIEDENLKYSFNIDNPKKIVLAHQADLELRNKIFKLISVLLLRSGNNLCVGYIRAKKFIEEFNKYIYNLNLSINYIDNYIANRYMSLDMADFIQDVDNIIKDLFCYIDSDKKIDEYGLSIDTIKKLKTYKIHNTSDVLKKMNPSFMINDPIYTVRFCPRDEEIIRSIFEKAKGDEWDQMHSNLLDSLDKYLDNNDKFTNLTSPKKKHIFMKRLSKK